MSFLEDMVPQEDMGDGQHAPVTPLMAAVLVLPSVQVHYQYFCGYRH